jgi:hypothetical protein
LSTLLEKDFGASVRSGFEATGLYPLSVDRATSKLPKELDETEVGTAVQKQLLKTLNDMRFNPPPTKHAQRPKKTQKLPAGASYTCTVNKETHAEEEEESEDSEDFSDSDTDSEERSRLVDNIVVKLGKKRKLDDTEDEEVETADEETADEETADEETADELLQGVDPGGDQVQGPPVKHCYPAESFIVAVYQGDWYVGQVMNKDGEPEAEESDSYLLVSFMVKMKGEQFKWPSRSDILNVLKDDVLFSCAPPIPGPSTSSSRVNSYRLSKEDLAKAKNLFMENQAYYPTKICVCGCRCVCGCVCVYRYHWCVCVCTATIGVFLCSCWYVPVLAVTSFWWDNFFRASISTKSSRNLYHGYRYLLLVPTHLFSNCAFLD